MHALVLFEQKTQISTNSTDKVVVFKTLFSLVGRYQHFGGTYCLSMFKDRGRIFLWNTGSNIEDYTMLQPRRYNLNIHCYENLKLLLVALKFWDKYVEHFIFILYFVYNERKQTPQGCSAFTVLRKLLFTKDFNLFLLFGRHVV
jgi:hypothetical protein